MRIVVLTQRAPLYLEDFFTRLLARLEADGHAVTDVFLFPAVGKRGTLAEARSRLRYYGAIGFVKLALRIAANQIRRRLGRATLPELLRARGIAVHAPPLADAGELAAMLADIAPDLGISIACPRVLKPDVLGIPTFGCINYHTGMLPRYRGRQPLFWAMLHDEPSVGITVHEMDAELDNGPILVQRAVPVDPADRLHDLYRKTIAVGPEVLAEAVAMLATGNTRRIANPKAESTYFSFPTAADSRAFRAKGKRFY